MPRENYNGPTPETENALRDRVESIAYEMQKSRQYLDAILAGISSDPFLKFQKLFRAVARKFPEAARGYIARLNTILREESPKPEESSDVYELSTAFSDLLAVAARREEGQVFDEEVEAAKHRFAEKLARFRVRTPRRGREFAPLS